MLWGLLGVNTFYKINAKKKFIIVIKIHMSFIKQQRVKLFIKHLRSIVAESETDFYCWCIAV